MVTGVIDAWIVYRVLRILTTPWDEMDAFRYGIIDATGAVLRKQRELKTSDEKNSYTLLHRLVFNLKRILEKLPFGKTKLARYATALFLLKEHMQTTKGKRIMEETFTSFLRMHAGERVVLKESVSLGLEAGRYRTLNNMLDSEAETVKKGSVIVVPKTVRGQRVLGVEVFRVMTVTGQELAVSHDDIEAI